MLIQYNADLLPKVRMMGRIRYSEDWMHFSRVSDEYILYVLREGDLYLQENDIPYHLTAGDFFILEPGLMHAGYKRATCDYYYAHFTHPDISHVSDEREEEAMNLLEDKRKKSLVSYNLDADDPTDPITYLPKYFHLSGTGYRALLQSAVDVYNRREEHYKRVVSAQLHSLFLDVAHKYLIFEKAEPRKNLKKSEVLAEQLLTYLNQNYSQPLSGAVLAEQFEMSFDYMNRIFSSFTGSPIFSYLNMVRINQACQLIATTDLPFSEVAYLVGIDDRYYFSKLFRKKTGMSPTEYYKETRQHDVK